MVVKRKGGTLCFAEVEVKKKREEKKLIHGILHLGGFME